MHPKDIFLFLIGNEGAIKRVAGSWWSLLIGSIFVLTAGIARNYDHLDLLRNPEWIYGPFIASVITSLIVFSIVKTYLKLRGDLIIIKGRQYVSFLCLYWMTAPCAWLYGLPVEAYTDLLTATKWNIAFLAIVSVWRVTIMTRSLAVLTKASPAACLLAVLLPASAIMCIGSFFKGISLVGIMGGVRLPPHTQLLHDTANFTAAASFWLALATLVFAITCARQLQNARAPLPWRKEKAPVKTILISIAFLMVWLTAAYPKQLCVQRNHHLESLIEKGQFKEAIRYASQFKKDSFSTIHYLPPDPRRRSLDTYRKILFTLDGSEPVWLRETWIKQYTDTLLSSRHGLSKKDRAFIQKNPHLQVIIENHPDKETNQEFPLPQD